MKLGTKILIGAAAAAVAVYVWRRRSATPAGPTLSPHERITMPWRNPVTSTSGIQ